MGSGVGFVSTTLAIFPGIPSFVATPYLLKGSKMPEEDYQKAQARGSDYLESFQAGWKKETRSKKTDLLPVGAYCRGSDRINPRFFLSLDFRGWYNAQLMVVFVRWRGAQLIIFVEGSPVEN